MTLPFMQMGKTRGEAGLEVETGNSLLGMASLRCPLDIQGEVLNRQDYRPKGPGLETESSRTERALLGRVPRKKGIQRGAGGMQEEPAKELRRSNQ